MGAKAVKPASERPAKDAVEAGELTASGRRKRKDTGARREGAAKGWTEEEERLFLEGLQLHGRDWHRAAAHVGTASPSFHCSKLATRPRVAAGSRPLQLARQQIFSS